MTEKEAYLLGAGFFGFLAFIGIWLYSISEWGLLIGLMVGWFPAIIGAVVLGILWLPALVILCLLLLFANS